MKVRSLIVAAGLLVLIVSCKKDDFEHCGSLTCSTCYHEVDCSCVPDSVNFFCPPEIVHGIYDYYDCNCRCKRGWTGTLCDQRDTNFYVQFRFGIDTVNLSMVRTSSISLSTDSPIAKFYDFSGSLPPGNEIDSVVITQLPNFAIGNNFNVFCVAVADTCTHLEMFMHSGETAIAISGELSSDTANSIWDFGGTFKANLYSSTGKTYYMRDGKYFLPFFQ